MANSNKLQPSIRPIRSQYRVTYDRDTGRTIYTPFNEVGISDFVEFFANVSTAFLAMYFFAKAIPFVNAHWPLAGLIFLFLCWQQHESWTRWPVRCVLWALFWGIIAL